MDKTFIYKYLHISLMGEELEILKSQSNNIDEQDNRHDSIISE